MTERLVHVQRPGTATALCGRWGVLDRSYADRLRAISLPAARKVFARWELGRSVTCVDCAQAVREMAAGDAEERAN